MVTIFKNKKGSGEITKTLSKRNRQRASGISLARTGKADHAISLRQTRESVTPLRNVQAVSVCSSLLFILFRVMPLSVKDAVLKSKPR